MAPRARDAGRRPLGRALLLTAATLLACAALVVLALAAAGERGASSGPSVRLSAAADGIAIANSRAGEAVLTAHGMVPGASGAGEVTVSNPGGQPLAIDLAPREPAPGLLGRALELIVAEAGREIYRGSLSDLPRLPLGVFSPGESRDYSFVARLPAWAGNELQGRSTSVDLDWTATAGAPVSVCPAGAARARLFLHRGRSEVRAVIRYRTRARATVAVEFFQRTRAGGKGQHVARYSTTVPDSGGEWGLSRISLALPEARMRALRGSHAGFVAQLRVRGGGPRCLQRRDLHLTEPRRAAGHRVWFEEGSFPRP